MDRTGADAYAYAKACGLSAKSWIGERARPLFAARRVQDLWALLFAEDVPLIPEGLIAQQIERKSEERIVREFARLLSAYDRPDPVSTTLLSLYEYGNLKAAVAALALGKTELPYIVDVGRFSFIAWDAWPDLEAMTRNTPAAWLKKAPSVAEEVALETRLDQKYYQTLFASLQSLSAQDRDSAEPLVREEIILQNISWALRLRVYYGRDASAIAPLLSHFGRDLADAAPLVAPALAILDRPVDAWDAWQAWKYGWLLNPHEEGVPWSIDPRWVQLAADRYLYRLARARFHQTPFTVGMLVSFFKIKQLEVQMIRVASEGLRLGASEAQMRDFMGDGENA